MGVLKKLTIKFLEGGALNSFHTNKKDHGRYRM